MALRIINIVLTIWFVLNMVVQFNDPDPLFWVLVYGGVAIIAAFAVFGKFNVPVIVIAFVVCLGGSLYLMPSVIELFLHHDAGELITGMSPDRPYVEEARESLGLLIGAAALVYFFVLARKASKSATT
jgi:hypothetical protein